MKVYMIADKEGASGVCSHDHVSRGCATYSEGRRLLTSDVNAAVEGAIAAGATEVIVADIHDSSYNLLPEEVHLGAKVVYGVPHYGSYLPFLDSSVDMAFLIAHHAKAGTVWGIFEHTINSGAWHRLQINGREVGEIGLHAGLAGSVGVPVVLITGDSSACTEAAELLGPVKTVAVKQGLGRYRALCLSPVKTRQLISEAAREALTLKDAVRPHSFGSPVEITVTYKNTQDADQVLGNEVGVGRPHGERVDGYTVAYHFETFAEWYGGNWRGQHQRQRILESQV